MSRLFIRTLLFAFLCALGTGAQTSPQDPLPRREPEETKLPNGKNQKDEILKADHEKSLADADRLIKLSEDLKASLEKNMGFVMSIDDLKKLDEMEKLMKRIRSRIKRY